MCSCVRLCFDTRVCHRPYSIYYFPFPRSRVSNFPQITAPGIFVLLLALLSLSPPPIAHARTCCPCRPLTSIGPTPSLFSATLSFHHPPCPPTKRPPCSALRLFQTSNYISCPSPPLSEVTCVSPPAPLLSTPSTAFFAPPVYFFRPDRSISHIFVPVHPILRPPPGVAVFSFGPGYRFPLLPFVSRTLSPLMLVISTYPHQTTHAPLVPLSASPLPILTTGVFTPPPASGSCCCLRSSHF